MNLPRLAAILLVAAVAHIEPSAAQFPDPERFEDAIRAFEEQDRLDPPPEGAIVLTGSSSIARWNDQAQEALAPLTVIPRGFGGSVMHDVLHYLDRIALNYKPRAILIYEGDNDTGQREPIPNDLILEDLRTIIARVHDELPDTRIYVLSVKPSILRRGVWPAAQEVNAGYRAIADVDPLVYYVDAANPFLQGNGEVMTDIFVADNLHLNDLGNAIWGATIKAALMPMEARFESHSQADKLAAIEAGIQAWADAYNSHDPERVLARYHPEAVFWGTVTPTLRDTPEKIAEYFSGLGNRPDAHVEIGEHRVQIFGELAIAAGFYTFTDVRNGETVTNPSRFSFALRLSDGDWLLAQHHSSRVP